MARPKKTESEPIEIHSTPKASKAPASNKWRQKTSTRFDDFASAKEHFDTLPKFKETNDGKKRIKRRFNKEEGVEYFDVIVYELAPKKKEPEPEEEATEEAA